MLFGEGFEEPNITDCTAPNALCHGRFPEQWALLSGRAAVTVATSTVFTGKQALRVDSAARLLNAGLRRLGIATTQGWTYEGSFYYLYEADPPTSKLASTIKVSLVTNELHPRVVATTASGVPVLAPTGGQWQRFNFTLAANLYEFF